MSFPFLPIWPFLLAVIPLLLLLKKSKEAKGPKSQLPPSPPKLPILGNIHQLGELPHQSLRQISQKYGPVILLKIGRIPLLVISSAEAAREVMKAHDLDCCTRPKLASTGKLTYNYLDIAFSPYGEYWREVRKLCVLKIFSVKRVQSFRSLREEEVGLLMNSIAESSLSGAPVDITQKIFALTGGILFRMAFGSRFRGSNLDNDKFAKLVHSIQSIVERFTAAECFPYVGWIYDRITGYHTRLESVYNTIDAIFQRIIDDHMKPERKKLQEHEDIIDVMLKMKNDNIESGDGSQRSKDFIKAILLNMFMGGIDTSAITVIWAMAELIRNPRLMKKAQDEVRKHVGNQGSVKEVDLDHLPYLKMIIKETLRLHPPAPLLVLRETMSHFKVNGYDIQPKTLIQVNAWAIGRDLKYWKNPEEFFPDRFIDNPIDFRGHHFEFIPFGAGRRSCPGVYMGLITSEIALANLLYCFNWKLPNGMTEEDMNMEENPGISLTVSKKTALNLIPINYIQ